LGRRIAEVKPHIVHIDEEPYNLATFHALRLARRAGAKTLFFSWQNIARRYPLPFSWMERWVLQHVDYGLVGNREAIDVWRGKGYTGPLALIPQFGVDPDIFFPAAPAQPSGIFRIGFAGRLVEEKGLDLLIRATAQVPAKTNLRLAGAGPLRDDLIRWRESQRSAAVLRSLGCIHRRKCRISTAASIVAGARLTQAELEEKWRALIRGHGLRSTQ
jgi:glycosyltransferase involved in cell wall biosynthesis